MTFKKILPVIVIAQFCCTSLWFAGNAVMSDLILSFQLPRETLGLLTSSVQFGFISGTLLFALFSIADRFSPSKIFFACALAGATFNIVCIWQGNNLITLIISRFLVGFFLAGIYPIGMKIAADHFQKGLGRSLGFLVGALVLGTAFPHLLKSITASLPYRSVIFATSILAVFGGLSIRLFVPDGPFRKAGIRLKWHAFLSIFKNREFRKAAFGYFGHMWELYTFWAFVPMLLNVYSKIHKVVFNIPLWSFIIIASGGLACILGGFIAEKIGTKKTAFLSLSLSSLCCVCSPIFFNTSEEIFFIFLIFWGMVVVADSPLFSTLVAQNAASEIKGTALTTINCLGYAITIVSILVFNFITEATNSVLIFSILAIGPILGLIGLGRNFKKI